MKNNILFIGLVMMLTSCGGGNNEDVKPSITVNGSIAVTDIHNWIDTEQLNVGLFKDDAVSPYKSIVIDKPVDNQPVKFYMDEVDAGTYDCKVFISDSRSVNKVTLYHYDRTSYQAHTQLSDIAVTLVSYSRVQEQVFNGCLICHGSSAMVEAGLFLSADKSYDALVNVPSTVEPDRTIVLPGNAENSFLMTVLRGNSSFDHSYSSTLKEEDIMLVENWINDGAEKDEGI